MALHRIALPLTGVDNSGSVSMVPYDATDGTANDVWKHLVAVFNDTSTDLYAYGFAVVPKNYVGSAAVYVLWNADNNVVTNKVKWGFSYRTLVANDSLDQATAQESVQNATGTTTSGTADGLNLTQIGTLTAGNFAADDAVEYRLERLGSDTTNDTLAGRAVVHGLLFQYGDA